MENTEYLDAEEWCVEGLSETADARAGVLSGGDEGREVGRGGGWEDVEGKRWEKTSEAADEVSNNNIYCFLASRGVSASTTPSHITAAHLNFPCRPPFPIDALANFLNSKVRS